MARRTKHEIKMKALRAAAGVALFTGTLACGTTDLDPLKEQRVTRPVEQPADDAGSIDAGFIDAGFADAGFPDAGLTTCNQETMTTDDYIACCTEIGWDWERGCAAWGPPAPPAMEVA